LFKKFYILKAHCTVAVTDLLILQSICHNELLQRHFTLFSHSGLMQWKVLCSHGIKLSVGCVLLC